MNPKLTAERLDRGAMVYIRQSTPGACCIIRRPEATVCSGGTRAPVGFPADRGDRRRIWDARDRVGSSEADSSNCWAPYVRAPSERSSASKPRAWRAMVESGIT